MPTETLFQICALNKHLKNMLVVSGSVLTVDGVVVFKQPLHLIATYEGVARTHLLALTLPQRPMTPSGCTFGVREKGALCPEGPLLINVGVGNFSARDWMWPPRPLCPWKSHQATPFTIATSDPECFCLAERCLCLSCLSGGRLESCP